MVERCEDIRLLYADTTMSYIPMPIHPGEWYKSAKHMILILHGIPLEFVKVCHVWEHEELGVRYIYAHTICEGHLGIELTGESFQKHFRITECPVDCSQTSFMQQYKALIDKAKRQELMTGKAFS